MFKVICNIQTKEIEIVEVPDVETPVVDISQKPTTDEKIATMAEQLLATQEQLNSAQDALDFILMGGM